MIPTDHLALPAGAFFLEGPTHSGLYWRCRCACGFVGYWWHDAADLNWEWLTHLQAVSAR